jgi:hypothetical protein
MTDGPEPYLIEFIRYGRLLKVTACDPATGVEVSIQAPLHADQHGLAKLAVRKLEYRLSRLAEEE